MIRSLKLHIHDSCSSPALSRLSSVDSGCLPHNLESSIINHPSQKLRSCSRTLLSHLILILVSFYIPCPLISLADQFRASFNAP